MVRTKPELIQYVADNVYPNLNREITGQMNQDALKAMIEDCYNYKTVENVVYASGNLNVTYTDSTTASYAISFSVVQTTGTSTTSVMSQNAVTQALAGKTDNAFSYVTNGTTTISSTTPEDTLTVVGANGIAVDYAVAAKRITIGIGSGATGPWVVNGANTNGVNASVSDTTKEFKISHYVSGTNNSYLNLYNSSGGSVAELGGKTVIIKTNTTGTSSGLIQVDTANGVTIRSGTGEVLVKNGTVNINGSALNINSSTIKYPNIGNIPDNKTPVQFMVQDENGDIRWVSLARLRSILGVDDFGSFD